MQINRITLNAVTLTLSSADRGNVHFSAENGNELFL